jgi:hypothetical protein
MPPNSQRRIDLRFASVSPKSWGDTGFGVLSMMLILAALSDRS